MIYDVAIIGAGASGLMCAAHLKQRSVLLIDHNSEIGAKIKISGGGKCNITNEHLSTDAYLANPEFITPALNAFNQHSLLAYMRQRGVDPKIRFKAQYFCRSALDVIESFTRETSHVKRQLKTSIIDLFFTKEHFVLKSDSQTFHAHRVVLATGGMSYTKIGGSDLGLKIAQNFGHQLIRPEPALVGFTLQPQEAWMKSLSGIVIEASVTLAKQTPYERTFTEELLFAHKGLSGPAILNASVFWKKGPLLIDFIPEHSLKSLLLPSKKQLSSLLPLPKRLSKALLAHLGIRDLSPQSLSKEERSLLTALKAYRFAPAGTFGFSKAEAMRGGIATDNIDPITMESLHQKGLYLLGEMLDVTGRLGGYNFQWAFASGVACAKALNKQF